MLLLHHLQEWKASHDGKYPDTFREKKEFQNLVRSAARTDNAEGGEENYDEACGAVLKTITPPAIGSGCRDMFEVLRENKHESAKSSFWTIAQAIKQFYEKYGVLPLPGSLPDMKAKSADYVKLQNIYKSKARADVAEVEKSVRTIEEELGRSPAPTAEIEAFCKNGSHIKVAQGTPLPSLHVGEPSKTFTKTLQNAADDESSLLPIWIGLQSSAAAMSQRKYPIQYPEEYTEKLDAAEEEIERASGGELHNISSVTGGMVAQECIKIITRQYVPVDNTCIFDGVRGRTEVFRLV